MRKIADNIAKVRGRIQQAAQQSNRPPGQVLLLAVSKTHSSTEITEAYDAGIRDFGENYLQEALPKIAQLKALDIRWHFIAPLQSNKAKSVAEYFHWLHSLDRLKIAEKLHSYRPADLKPLNICVQVNIDAEASKSGIQPEKVPDFIHTIAGLQKLSVRGLMAIPDPQQPVNQLESSFAAMQDLFLRCQQQFPHLPLDTLSMGMSQDLELAIAHGATIVRVGTAIFGPRNPKTT